MPERMEGVGQESSSSDNEKDVERDMDRRKRFRSRREVWEATQRGQIGVEEEKMDWMF